MKKILTLMLIGILALSLVACGGKETDGQVKEDISIEENADVENNEVIDEETADEKEEEVKEEVKEEKPATKPADKKEEKPEENQETTSGTPAQILFAEFKKMVKENPSADPLTIAQALIENPIIPFMGGAMEVEPGWLPGFGEDEIHGFKSGANFGPMISTIPFIGYIFEIEDQSKVADFVKLIDKNANKAWNICTTAEEKLVSSEGNKVFMIMCNKSFDEE